MESHKWLNGYDLEELEFLRAIGLIIKHSDCNIQGVRLANKEISEALSERRNKRKTKLVGNAVSR